MDYNTPCVKHLVDRIIHNGVPNRADLRIYGFTDLRIYGFTDLRIYGSFTMVFEMVLCNCVLKDHINSELKTPLQNPETEIYLSTYT